MFDFCSNCEYHSTGWFGKGKSVPYCVPFTVWGVTMRRRLLCLLVALGCVLSFPVTAAEGHHPGRQANLSGQKLQEEVTTVMEQAGFTALSHAQWLERGRPTADLLLSRVPYTNLYGDEGRQSFRILSPRRGLEVGLIIRRQDSEGSNDTKLPHLYLTAVEAMGERTVLILVDGTGWRDGGLAWLRRTVAERRYGTPADKDVRVMSLEEFRHWAKGL